MNGKRNPETQIIGKKKRKLSKKKAKLEKIQKFQRRLRRR
jgi:RNase H-fold protein (predicted Holliday junction resolvase)